MLRIRSLEAGYGNLKVLRRVSIHVSPGEIVTIIGANGAGKTTLLLTIAGLLRAQTGEILFDEQDIGRHAPEAIALLGLRARARGAPTLRPHDRARESATWRLRADPPRSRA